MRRNQPLVIRITHWLNVPALIIMIGSGLQIWQAYPRVGPRGTDWSWFPWQGWKAPSWARLGDWLAGARHLHFTFAWLLVLNGLAYLVYLLATREFARRWFHPRRDGRNALRTALGYLRFRETPAMGLYNGLQRAAYTGAAALAVIEVASGFAIWKPVQLRWLGALFGGYDGARTVHFLAMMALLAFTAGHLVMVATHPKVFKEMVTGGPRREVER